MAWANSVSITINHLKVPNTDQTNFAVLFTGLYTQLAGTAYGGAVTNSNGYDIIFASDSAGASPFAFERVAYVLHSGMIECWIKIPTVSHTADTTIYILFGNSAITTDQATPAAVWDASFEAVWHFGYPSSLALTDSTSNGVTLTNSGATAVLGKIAGGASFNGSNAFMSSSSAALNNWTNQTISCWVNANTGMAADARLIEKGSNNEWTIIWNYVGGSNKLTVQALGGPTNLLTSAAALTGAWHKIDVTITSANVVSLYVDGVLDSSATSGTGPASKTNALNVGQYGGGGYNYSGLMDELRISNAVRSADWIATQFNNQSSPSTFYTTSLTVGSGIAWGPFPTPSMILTPQRGLYGALHQTVRSAMSPCSGSSASTGQRGNIDYDQIRASVRQGTGGRFQMYYGGPPAANDIAVWDGHGNLIDSGLRNPTWVFDEIPIGTVNGTNAVFTLANAPNPSTSLGLTINGIEQFPGHDYSITGNTITFLIAPLTGDWLYANYSH
jgi:hypothetical protein